MRRWIAALFVVLAACGSPAEVPPTPQAQASGTVPAALDWTADLVEGGQLAGGDLVGGDVVLWFWAPW